jgi:hypothetical protein
MVLTLRFTRLSPAHHRFEYRRADGSGEVLELETRSFLVHDLLHYAVESEAGLRGSFYGLLDRIGGYAELSVSVGGLGGEAQLTEMIVGPLTSTLDSELDADALISAISGYFDDMDLRPPRWFTPAFVAAVRERMRRLEGQWKATPFGEAMVLTFDAR